MNSPFYQPSRQNFSASQSMQQPQGGFGGGAGFGGYSGFGGFGGFQSQPSYGGFGGGFGGFNPMFSGLGGLGFNPMLGQQFMQPMNFGYGGFGGFGGGFQPQGFGGFSPYQQPQFNPFQGGFGGGLNPMFGGLGGLGFNPMMGPQFMQPMQGFDPYQQFQQPQDFGSLDMRYRGGPQMSPEMRQRREQDMRALETQAGSLLTGPTTGDINLRGRMEQNNPGMMALQQAALRNASLQELATPVENRVSMPSNDWWKTPDAETQYQQEQAAAQQQRAMNPGGRSIQDWQNEYNQLYPANRMTMNVAPSLEQFIQRRSNPISFPGMPGFTL